jgi:hypothetical protein
MRATVTPDEKIVAKARALTGGWECHLLREALRLLIERESARRLARLGGSSPELKRPRRRRSAWSAAPCQPPPPPIGLAGRRRKSGP